MSDIIPFKGQSCPIFIASLEKIEIGGKQRERWLVVVLNPDGTRDTRGPIRSKADAEWLANIMVEDHARERIQRNAHPLISAIMELPEEFRDKIAMAIKAELDLPSGRK